ncbi:M1 family metallopeptidase [Flavobacterium sp. GT3P67]|uniref:M1 family metallopeptidase n=1 Tax=Flavobacterium sp. GT3P67 TaxID=2541722 RepID=UPI001050D41A|nr:M1 family aminopeptidase [Flavobacterium sp. GT3P67]TDE55357.1 peptidase M1 [Flavobacterium sp. GT3P67]
MKIPHCFLCLFLVISSCQTLKETNIVLQNGVSKELASFRKQQVSDVAYKLSFAIPEKKDSPIPSELVLNLNVLSLKEPLYLDFNEKTQNLKSVTVNGVAIAVQQEKEHLVIPRENLKLGSNLIAISFIAGDLSLNRNADFLYTLLVPDRASTLFPCFDQPDIKARYTLTITAPKDWSVLCGAPLVKQIDQGDFVQYEFGETDKMSTYLFSFVAGKFKSISKNPGAFEMKMLFRENDVKKIQASTDVIFKTHQQAIDFLEKYTQHPFPFQKMDFAAIPVFQYGGMEHVGAIQYKESALFLDNSATDSDKLERGKLIAHETAHMWFGDLVTMKWFDDVWMKEVFANFMAGKIMNPVFPEVNHDLQFLTTHYPNAYGEDRSAGTHPIKQNLANLKDAGSLYGSIIYNKAPIMMRQLETSMGEEAFRKGIQVYIKKYANDNADWNNLVEILDTKTPLDMKQWSSVWVNQSGRPLLTERIVYDAANRIKSFEIYQQAEDQSKNLWPQIFEIGLVYPDSTRVITVSIKNKMTKLNAAIGLAKPITIIYNYNGYGYGVFPIDVDRLDYFPSVQNEVARAYSYINLYENTLTGKIAPLEAFNSCLKGIATESNELVAKLLSNQLTSIFWKFLSPKQQIEGQKELENLVYQRLQTKLPANLKKTIFGLFSSIAYSESGKEKLYQIWNKETTIPDLKLNEDDFTNMAMDLAIFQHEKAEEILNQTKATISNPDKQKRFEFLLPSLSKEEAVRDAFMESLKDEKNREKEAWVLTALGNIHHPLRQESGKKHLKDGLYLIEEIKRTGDIFFPKGWLSGSIGRYSSVYAFDVVQQFLKDNPDFSPILKRKLLQATDGLYRAQKIIK